MSDFSALIASVESYIRQNGNNEITGNILQEVLVGIINTLGTTAINALETGLSTEQTTRANADTALGGRIDTAEGNITSVTNLATTLQSRLDEGFIYKGIATPTTNPSTPTGKVFYVAVQGGTYTNFGGLTVSQGINIIKYNGSTWSVDVVIAIDDDPHPTSKNLANADAVAKAAMYGRAMYPDRCLLDYNHIMNYPSSDVAPIYNQVDTYNAIWIPIMHGATHITIKYDGTVVTPLISFWSSEWYDNDYYIGKDNDTTISPNKGDIPNAARLAVINFIKTSYPDTSLITIEQDGKMFPVECETKNRQLCWLPARGVFIDYGYIANFPSSGVVVYQANPLWDCIWIPITSKDAKKMKVTLAGLADNAAYRFFTSLVPSTETYITSNPDGVIPEGAKLCVINKLKSGLTETGYDDIHVSFSSQERKKIRLLSIGNSYSDDALAYVPYIIQNMGVDVDIQIGILMMSSSGLADHVANFANEEEAYSFRYNDGGEAVAGRARTIAWQNLGTHSIQWALDNYEWDYIVLQASSQQAFDWSKYQPSCNILINDVAGYVDYPVKFMWYMPMARPAQTNSGANWPDAAITEHYEATAGAAERIMDETVCEVLVPVGTAIQNVRTIPTLKAMGAYADNPLNTSDLGYLTPNDGVHLQEGLPCQIAAYSFVLVLLREYGFANRSIVGETTRVTSEWAADKNIPSPHGSYIGSTDENCLIVQKAVVMAVKHPYEVTDMSYIINPT